MIKPCSVGCIAQLATPRSTDKSFLESHEILQAISFLVGNYIRMVVTLDTLPTSYVHLTFAVLKRDTRLLTILAPYGRKLDRIAHSAFAVAKALWLYHHGKLLRLALYIFRLIEKLLIYKLHSCARNELCYANGVCHHVAYSR